MKVSKNTPYGIKVVPENLKDLFMYNNNSINFDGTNWIVDENIQTEFNEYILNSDKEIAISQLDDLLAAAKEVGFFYTYNSIKHKFYCSDSTVNKIMNSANLLISNERLGKTITTEQLSYYCCSNIKVQFANIDDFLTFATALQDHVDTLDKKKLSLKEEIKNCTTRAEVANIQLVI